MCRMPGKVADLVVMSKVIKIHAKWTKATMPIGNEAYEKTQQERPLDADGSTDPLNRRDYALLEVARGTIEKNVKKSVVSLMTNSNEWAAIRGAARTEARENQAFRLLARTLALAQYEEDRGANYPERLFLLVTGELASDQVMKEQCQWTPWVEGFVKFWVSKGGLDHIDCRVDLHVMLIILFTNTAALEAKHAALRRQAVVRSCQCPTMAAETASAEEVLRRVREYKPAFAKVLEEFEGLDEEEEPQGTKTDGEGDGQDDGNDDHPGDDGPDVSIRDNTKRGGGGSWRAFVSLVGSSMGFDFAHIARLYHALTDDQKAVLPLPVFEWALRSNWFCGLRLASLNSCSLGLCERASAQDQRISFFADIPCVVTIRIADAVSFRYAHVN